VAALRASDIRPDSLAHGVVHEFGRPQRVHRGCRHLVRSGFVSGLQQLGFSLFLWGVFATSAPLILAMYIGKYLFRFDDAILLGCCSGARTTTASLGMINDRAKSQIPGLGYTVTYAVGNTLLTIWGMVLVILLT
jgi:putative transport protein